VSLAEQIIEHGPYPDGEINRLLLNGDEANELRDELLELRRLRAAAEARERFDIDLFGADAEGWLHCDRCSEQIQLGDTTGLAELDQRAEAHAEVCR
jgi:hypothetical protein